VRGQVGGPLEESLRQLSVPAFTYGKLVDEMRQAGFYKADLSSSSEADGRTVNVYKVRFSSTSCLWKWILRRAANVPAQ
jgi:hypothetical protein